jgi:hypothetical protein
MFTKMARAVTMRLLTLQRMVYAARDVAHELWKLDPKAPDYDRTIRTLIRTLVLRVDEITAVFDSEMEMELEEGDIPVVGAWVVHFMEEDGQNFNEECIVGPFDSEQQASGWVNAHCTYAEDRKFHIIEISTNPREFDNN